MSYTLIIGPKNYSSWSMRAWLLLRWLQVPFEEVSVDVYAPGCREAVRALGGEPGLVPVLQDGGLAIWDTPAIFEHLYELYPQVWPADRGQRARARSLCGEVHAGFGALRAAMPVNTRARGRVAQRSAEVEADIARTGEIWSRHEPGGWLFGEFGGADIMFAPIATRFQTYGVTLGAAAAAYQDRTLAHPLVREWLRLGEQETGTIPVLEVG